MRSELTARDTSLVDPIVPPWKLYERHAELWKQSRLPGVRLERAWLDRLCEQLDPQAQVLDVGCGHGQPLGAQLLADGFDVWGIDRAPSLIEAARAALPAGQWRVADMTSFDLGRVFGGIVMWHSLFHLTATEQRQVFPLLAGHAEPGSVLLFTAGPSAGTSNGEFGGDDLAHYSLDPAEYESLLAEANFTVLDYRETDPDCGGATVWFAKQREV